MKKLILASASPRRREILTQLGISFDVCTASVSEIIENENPELIPRLLAERKALAVSLVEQDVPVLGFDTLVFSSDGILGKPRDAAHALEMLQKLNAKTHTVISGVSLAYQGQLVSSTEEKTKVTFRNLSLKTLENYVASGEPLDKAGAYGIQGLGAGLVREISGCYYNVVGLPVAKTLEMLEAFEENYV
jgi:septum formation protein